MRLRTTDGRALEATLKSMAPADGSGVAVREERTIELDGPVRDARLLPDAAMARLVTAIVGRRPLVPIARVRTLRTRRRIRVDGELVVEASVDRGSVSAGGHSAPIAELEVERIKGDEATFRAFLDRAWRDRRVRRGGPSKFERALRLARIPLPSATSVAAARLSLEDVGPATSSARAGARDLARNAAALERAVAAARRGAVEGVHDTRVLSRRLRAVLAFHAPDLDDALVDDARVRLRALRRAAGPVRDLDVLAAAIRGATLPRDVERGRALLLDVVKLERQRARPALGRALASPRLAGLAARWARPAEELSRRASIPFALAAALRLPRAIEATLAARRAIAGPLDEAGDARVHALRIAAKRARYGVEACLEALGRPARRFARRLREFADVAGALRDAEAQKRAIRALVGAVPRFAGERAAAEKAAAAMSEALDAAAARARTTLDARYRDAAGPEAIRELLDHLSKRAAEVA